MRSAGFIWGVGGILLLLSFAIVRLGAVALEVLLDAGQTWELAWWHWLVLLSWTVYMLWAEGYKGFHRGFAPRVVARARYLSEHPRTLHVLLAPLFCMGYIHATPKRRLLSIGLTTMILCFVVLVRMLPQPWRGIVDFGVVAGLMLGVLSIFHFITVMLRDPQSLPVATDVPAS